VGNLENYIFVEGSVLRPARFELKKSSVTIDEILSQAIVDKQSTNFLVSRFEGKNNYISSIHSIKELDLELSSGDKIEFLKDSIARNVTVKIEGEHQNLHSMVVEKGTTLKSILEKINYSFLSQKNAIQLFRKSVAQKQKMLIEAQLKDIEAGALTTGSDTSEEAVIRAQESKLILEFVERARKVEPKGQVILNSGSDLSKIILEEGDTIFIPSVSHTVSIQGEVLLPGAQSFVDNLALDEYIQISGGYTNRANLENVLLIRQNGAVEKYNADSSFAKAPVVEPGDSILVLGEVDSKNLQIAKDVTQILYQIAVGAAVVLRAF
jgi:protein involved in polysaccharide export with SLBB domain